MSTHKIKSVQQSIQPNDIETPKTKITMNKSLGSTTVALPDDQSKSYQESRYDQNFKSAHEIMNMNMNIKNMANQKDDSQFDNKHYLPKLNRFCVESSAER